jgi:hypothetical protein
MIHLAASCVVVAPYEPTDYMREEYKDGPALERALGHHFESKVKFAKTLPGQLSDEVAESFLILHTFRNEVYHIGVRHEAVLPSLAVFCLTVACDFVANYSPPFLGWGSNQKLPERAKKFFSGPSSFPGTIEQYRSACVMLRDEARKLPHSLAKDLADHMSAVVEDMDSAIDLIATGAPRRATRDEVIIECQAWPIAFGEEGERFAKERGWRGNRFELITWIRENYPFKTRRDPIPLWRARVEKLRMEKKLTRR